MMDTKYLDVSDGTGDAALMHVESDRAPGATIIEVDITTKVPDFFIGTWGTRGADGFLTQASKRDFRGHLSGDTLVIDGMEPGSVDDGNTSGQIVIIKPNSGWSNRVASFIKNATNRGVPENITVDDILVSGDGTVEGNFDINGNLTVDGSFRNNPRISATDTTSTLTPNVDNYSQYDITAQTTALVIANPTGTPRNGEPMIIRIRDNGTSRAITYGNKFTNVSGLDTLTATVANKWHVLGIIYNGTTGIEKYQIVSISAEA